MLLAIPPSPTIDAVSFASKPGLVFVPVREAAKCLHWPMSYDPAVELINLRGKTLDPYAPRLSDGTWLISLNELAEMGARVDRNSVTFDGLGFVAQVGDKSVFVDLKSQVLWARQGKRLVYRWEVSSGRQGKETPTGAYRALGKEPMHISTLYGSPMPFSIHVTGNIYIHGSAQFSSTPGSHGCIRLPLMETRNIAEEFYNWIDVGTPIRVRGAYENWPSKQAHSLADLSLAGR